MQRTGNIDLDNKNKVFSIVKNHFDLTQKSLQSFKDFLYCPFVDPAYKQIIGNATDLRRRFRISPEDLEDFDHGWKVFKEYFPCFISFYNVVYDDFRRNKIQNKKTTIKIGKALLDFYVNNKEANKPFNEYDDDLTEDEIKCRLEVTGQTKLPLSSLEIVLSLNFADWFLCATAENWSSCLNLESRSSSTYWAGVPGAIVDKNRALVYITDGKKKKYQGIEVDRLISRSWLLLDLEDCINVVRFYPTRIIGSNILKKIISERFVDITENFVSKYDIPLISFKNNISAFIYNDNSKFGEDRNPIKKIIGSQEGGVEFFDLENGCKVDPPFYFRQGLGFLIEQKLSLCNIYYGICNVCSKKILEEEDLIGFREEILCKCCFNEKVAMCSECHVEILKAEANKGEHGYYYCNNCFENLFAECSSCGKTCRDFEIKDNKKYCFDCIASSKIEHIVACNKCGEENTKDTIFYYDSPGWICKNCKPSSNFIDYGVLFGDTTSSYTFTVNSAIGTNPYYINWDTSSLDSSTQFV